MLPSTPFAVSIKTVDKMKNIFRISITTILVLLFAISIQSCKEKPIDEVGVRYEGFHEKQSDEEFGNFRQITTTGMGSSLYRSASPIYFGEGRGYYALKAYKGHNITAIINFADTEESLKNQDLYKDSYYSKQNILCNYIRVGGADASNKEYYSPEFKERMKDLAYFIVSNPGEKYAIHCTIGRDRTGFSCAILEALMGATLEEIQEDYALSYENLEDYPHNYPRSMENVKTMLINAFDCPDIENADLKAEAYEYFVQCRVEKEAIDKLIEILSK